MSHRQQQQPPMHSPSAYAQVPAPDPAQHAHDPVHPYGHGIDLGTAFPPTPFTPYTYHSHHSHHSHHAHDPADSLAVAAASGHAPLVPTPPLLQPPNMMTPVPAAMMHSPAPIPMPEPQRPMSHLLPTTPQHHVPAAPPPLPHRRHDTLPHAHGAQHAAAVLSPPLTATTQLLMPSPPSHTGRLPAPASRLFEEPVASAPGSSSFLVERVAVDDQGRPLVASASPPSASAPVPSTAPASSSSLSRLPPTAPAPISSSSSLARPTLPDWAKDPDDDRPPVRGPVYLTLPFVLKLLVVLTSLAAIVAVRVILPTTSSAAAAATAAAALQDNDRDDGATTFLLAYQWLAVISLAYALAHLVSFSACLYNRHARKVSVSRQRQAWKLNVRKWLVLPLEGVSALAWFVMSLLIGLVQSDWALYSTACSAATNPSSTAGLGVVAKSAGVVSCTQATTVLVLAAMLASEWGLSASQVVWAIWKNAKKVAEFSCVSADEQHAPGSA